MKVYENDELARELFKVATKLRVTIDHGIRIKNKDDLIREKIVKQNNALDLVLKAIKELKS